MAATHRTKSPNGERVRRKCASLSSQPVNVGAKANVPSEIVTSGLGTYLPWGIASKLAKANQLRQGIVLIGSGSVWSRSLTSFEMTDHLTCHFERRRKSFFDRKYGVF